MTTITIELELLEQALAALSAPNYRVFSESAVASKLRAALSAPETAPELPAWHDAPTCAGVWICDEDDICYTWTAHSIEILDQFDPGEGMRWFGPIPEDRP